MTHTKQPKLSQQKCCNQDDSCHRGLYLCYCKCHQPPQPLSKCPACGAGLGVKHKKNCKWLKNQEEQPPQPPPQEKCFACQGTGEIKEMVICRFCIGTGFQPPQPKQKSKIQKKTDLENRASTQPPLQGKQDWEPSEAQRKYWDSLRGVRNEKAPNWRGDRAGKGAIHTWLEVNYGKESICENGNCKGKCKTYDWCLKRGKKYKKDRNNFLRMCRSCHRSYDLTPVKKSQAVKNLWWYRKTGPPNKYGKNQYSK